MTGVLIAGAGVACAVLSIWGLRRALRSASFGWRMGGSIAAALLGLLAITLIVLGGVHYWYYHRPQPDPITDRPLFQGITYSRDVRRDPRPLVIHIVRVDLTAPGIAFLVTPGDPTADHQLSARKTSQFLAEFDLQVAVNGSFFLPWWSHSPWDYYPHVGDPVNVNGVAVSQGVIYSDAPETYPVLYLSASNRPTIDAPLGEPYNAVAGNAVLLRGDTVQDFPDSSFHTELHPRTAVGYDQSGETLILVVVDGRQPNYSEGVTLPELAAIMRQYGCAEALNLDGGGSSTLVIEDGSGHPDVLNSPIDNHIPGRERAVANHLGVWAQRVG